MIEKGNKQDFSLVLPLQRLSSDCPTGATGCFTATPRGCSGDPHSHPGGFHSCTPISNLWYFTEIESRFFSSQSKMMFSSMVERIWMKVFSEDGRSIMDGKDIQSNEFPE